MYTYKQDPLVRDDVNRIKWWIRSSSNILHHYMMFCATNPNRCSLCKFDPSNWWFVQFSRFQVPSTSMPWLLLTRSQENPTLRFTWWTSNKYARAATKARPWSSGADLSNAGVLSWIYFPNQSNTHARNLALHRLSGARVILLTRWGTEAISAWLIGRQGGWLIPLFDSETAGSREKVGEPRPETPAERKALYLDCVPVTCSAQAQPLP